MFIFRKNWRDLFSWNTRVEIRPFALLPTIGHLVITLTQLKQLTITLIDHQLQNHFDSYLKKSNKDTTLNPHKKITNPTPKTD